MYIYIYIYIYTYMCMYMCVYIYIYIYTYGASGGGCQVASRPREQGATPQKYTILLLFLYSDYDNEYRILVLSKHSMYLSRRSTVSI